MKDLFKVAFLATTIFIATQSNAQTVKADAKKVGRKTSEVAAKGAATVTDKKYNGKIGRMARTFTLISIRITFM